ncbi:MAG: (2Fe-2S)-binding protein [Woeseiaceae bacterium]
MAITFTLNGRKIEIDVDPQTSLLEVLRNDLELNGPRFGCGLAQCGACAVLLDGKSIRSCVTTVADVRERAITTLEGLGNAADPHSLQMAFIEEQALQCGYCTSGIIVAASALLETNPDPTDDEIKIALSGHLCRCGAHPRIVRAVARAAKNMK